MLLRPIIALIPAYLTILGLAPAKQAYAQPYNWPATTEIVVAYQTDLHSAVCDTCWESKPCRVTDWDDTNGNGSWDWPGSPGRDLEFPRVWVPTQRCVVDEDGDGPLPATDYVLEWRGYWAWAHPAEACSWNPETSCPVTGTTTVYGPMGGYVTRNFNGRRFAATTITFHGGTANSITFRGASTTGGSTSPAQYNREYPGVYQACGVSNQTYLGYSTTDPGWFYNRRGSTGEFFAYSWNGWRSGVIVIGPDPYSFRSGFIADFNGDGSAGTQDIFDFLGCYFGSDARADVDWSGTVNEGDLFGYLTAWFAS